MPYKRSPRSKTIDNAQDLLYGLHAIESLLGKNPARIIDLYWVSKEQVNPKVQRICKLASAQGIAVHKIKEPTLASWFQEKVVHQGLVAKVTPTKFWQEEDLYDLVKSNPAVKPVFLVLDQIQDPRNLGACIRNAAAFGVNAVMISKHASCDITATVKKVASGATEFVAIAKVGNLVTCIKNLKKLGVWVVALAADHAQNLATIDLNLPLALVIGSENTGIQQLLHQNCDFFAKIPIDRENAGIDSLNLAVAVGICLYEVNRQRNN